MFNKKTWKNRSVEHPGRRLLTTVSDNTEQLVDVERDEGTVIEEGDAFSANNMNDLEGRIEGAFDITTSTLPQGQTSIIIEDENITVNSILSFYTSIYGVSPNTVEVQNGEVSLTFDSQTTAMIVGVRIEGEYNA